MANFKYINDDKHTEIVMKGSLVDLLSNVCTLVHTLYERLPDEVAEQFKEELTDAFEKGLPFMKASEVAEKVQEVAPKALKKILGEIKDTLKDMKEDDEDA